MKINLDEKLDFSLDKAPSCWIKRTNSVNLLAFGLDKGQVLHKHKALYPTVVTVLKGKVEFEFDNEKLILNEDETLDLPENEAHEVTGLERSIFTLLQIKN
jgi:quercetin dioxygenase-like cupin family protein